MDLCGRKLPLIILASFMILSLVEPSLGDEFLDVLGPGVCVDP